MSWPVNTPLWARPRTVHHRGRAAEAVDRLGHEALAPDLRGARDLRLAAAPAGFRFLQEAQIGFRKLPVDEQRPRCRHAAILEIKRGRRGPVLAIEAFDRGNGRGRAFGQRMPVHGVTDCRLKHVAQAHGAVRGEHVHVGLEGARNARRQQTCARHDVEAEMSAVVRDGRARGRRALPANHLWCRASRRAYDHRHVAAWATQMRLDHLQRERRGDARVKGIAAALQDAHADGSADPVRRRNDSERAVDLGPRGEGTGIDVRHEATFPARRSRRLQCLPCGDSAVRAPCKL